MDGRLIDMGGSLIDVCGEGLNKNQPEVENEKGRLGRDGESLEGSGQRYANASSPNIQLHNHSVEQWP